MTPAFKADATLWTFEPFSDQIPAANPYGVSFAFVMASWVVRNVEIARTGPKTSMRLKVNDEETRLKKQGYCNRCATIVKKGISGSSKFLT
jgi:hypothetical protein